MTKVLRQAGKRIRKERKSLIRVLTEVPECGETILQHAKMSNMDRFSCWSAGFDESLNHEPSNASQSKKEAQFKELQWRQKIAENNLRVSSASAIQNGSSEIADSSSSTRNDSTSKDPTKYNCEDDFLKQIPASAGSGSISSSENLLRLMVREVEALARNLLENQTCFEDQELLDQLELARRAVVKYAVENHGKHLTKSVLKGFQFFTNIKINRIGIENQERKTKKMAMQLMMKTKVAALLETVQIDSLPPKFRLSNKLEATVLEKTTLELLGQEWVESFQNLKDVASDRLHWSLRQLQGLHQTLKKVFDNRNLPVLGTAKLKDMYHKTLQPVLTDLTSKDQLAAFAPLVQEFADSWYQPVLEKITAEEEIVPKARKYASERYLNMMLDKFPAGIVMKPEEVTKAHSEVRERIELAFFTVPDFQYSLLWTLDMTDEDLIEQFKKERLSRLFADVVVAENEARDAITAEVLKAQTPVPVPASDDTVLSASLEPGADIPVEEVATPDSTRSIESPFSSRSSASRHPSSHSNSSFTKNPTDTRPPANVKVAMYFSTDFLRILYEADGFKHQFLHPLTLSMTPGPDNSLILADENVHTNIVPLQLSAYIRDRNVVRPMGFHGVYSEVIMAVFIRKCMNKIRFKTQANLYDAVAVVALPASIMSSCRFRVKTALKLAGFRDVKIVQPTTALAISYNQTSASVFTENAYEILAVFLDENIIEVAQVLVEGHQYTTLDLKTFGVEDCLEPQRIIEAIQEYNRPSHVVFTMSHITDPDPAPYLKALRHHLPNKATIMCKPLFVALLPGLLSISGGTPNYKERFPFGIVVANTEIRLALQNTLIPAQRSETVFRLDEVRQDIIRVHRRYEISLHEEEEVSLHDAQNLFQEFPDGQVTVQVTNEGLVSIEFQTNAPGKPKHVKKLNKHLPVFGKNLKDAEDQIDAMMGISRFGVRPRGNYTRKRNLTRPNHAFKKRKTNQKSFQNR